MGSNISAHCHVTYNATPRRMKTYSSHWLSLAIWFALPNTMWVEVICHLQEEALGVTEGVNYLLLSFLTRSRAWVPGTDGIGWADQQNCQRPPKPTCLHGQRINVYCCKPQTFFCLLLFLICCVAVDCYYSITYYMRWFVFKPGLY